MGKKFFRKRGDPFLTIARIKLWPSRKGILHGLRTVKREGNIMIVMTHCNQEARVKCSKNGRLARWLRNKWYAEACPVCRVPEWKIEKYSKTSFVKGSRKKYERRSSVFKNANTATH
jgi:pyrrolysyl-tRNA synthetase-like protein